MGTSRISRNGGIIEKVGGGGYDPPLPTMTGRSGDKAINVCHVNYRGQYHCHVQGIVSTSWCTWQRVQNHKYLSNDYYWPDWSEDKTINVCHMTYKWWRHGQLQVMVSAFLSTILQILVVKGLVEVEIKPCLSRDLQVLTSWSTAS